MQIIEGQNIHYVAYNGRHLAGMIIGLNPVVEGAADLVIFTNMPNVNQRKNWGMQFQEDIGHSEMKEPGTWHFIEEVNL